MVLVICSPSGAISLTYSANVTMLIYLTELPRKCLRNLLELLGVTCT